MRGLFVNIDYARFSHPETWNKDLILDHLHFLQEHTFRSCNDRLDYCLERRMRSAISQFPISQWTGYLKDSTLRTEFDRDWPYVQKWLRNLFPGFAAMFVEERKAGEQAKVIYDAQQKSTQQLYQETVRQNELLKQQQQQVNQGASSRSARSTFRNNNEADHGVRNKHARKLANIDNKPHSKRKLEESESEYSSSDSISESDENSKYKSAQSAANMTENVSLSQKKPKQRDYSFDPTPDVMKSLIAAMIEFFKDRLQICSESSFTDCVDVHTIYKAWYQTQRRKELYLGRVDRFQKVIRCIPTKYVAAVTNKWNRGERLYGAKIQKRFLHELSNM